MFSVEVPLPAVLTFDEPTSVTSVCVHDAAAAGGSQRSGHTRVCVARDPSSGEHKSPRIVLDVGKLLFDPVDIGAKQRRMVRALVTRQTVL